MPGMSGNLRMIGALPVRSNVHHDALEFPDGKIVLCKGQRATVLQLPARASGTVDETQRQGSLVM